MDPKAMDPYGTALQAWFEGNTNAELLVRRDDGLEERLPISHFFRRPSSFTLIEQAAIKCCFGRVLDAGAGTGLHAVFLQQQGLRVTAIDVSPQAVQIMTKSGVEDARCVDIFDFDGGAFDTLLMMGHGIGIVETIAGLDRFLKHALRLVSAQGQILLDSVDIRATQNPQHLAYQQANRDAGRYFGEIRMQFEFGKCTGPYCGWLHIDCGTLKERAAIAGWSCEAVLQQGDGSYLARLRKQGFSGRRGLS